MSDVHDFAKFLNKIKAGGDGVTWTGEHLDALDKIFRGSRYFCHVVGDELVIPTTLPMESRMMLTRAWGGFRMLGAIIRRHVVPDTDGGTDFDWGYDPVVDSAPVANPDGIRLETKIETFIQMLNDDARILPSGPFTVKPWCDLHNIYSGSKRMGNIKGDRLMIASDVGPGVAEWLRETWRSLDGSDGISDWTTWRLPDAPPAIPPRVQRFLDALAEYEIGFKDDFGYTVEAPFTVTPPRSSGILITLGNGVEFGEINGDHFVADTSMALAMKATLEHIWRETIRVEAMIHKIADLEAELAAKTARLDQIAALLKANP